MKVFFYDETLVLNLAEHNIEIGVKHIDSYLNSLIEILVCEILLSHYTFMFL